MEIRALFQVSACEQRQSNPGLFHCPLGWEICHLDPQLGDTLQSVTRNP